MTHSTYFSTFFGALVSALAVIPTGAAAASTSASDTVDRISIYPSGAAVVADKRTIKLRKGDNSLEWPVVGHPKPATFWLAGDGVDLQGMTPADAGSSSKNPLEQRIGKEVRLTRSDEDTAKTATKTTRNGTLSALAGDTAYVETDGRTLRITPTSPWQISWSSTQQTDADTSSSAFRLDVNAQSAGRAKLRSTYQLSDISWQASTTGEYNADTGKLVFHSAAVVHNGTKSAIHASHANLIAGAINRAGNHRPRPMAMAAARKSDTSASRPEQIGHGYRYDIGSIKLSADQTRTFSIISRTRVEAKRRFIVANRFHSQYSGAERRHASVRLAFDNPTDAPLPAGAFRVYSAERPATLLGADQIGNTPAGAPVTLDLGRAFDVTSARKIAADTSTNGKRQRTIVVQLRNAGSTSAHVKLDEHLPKQAKLVSASRPVDNNSPGHAHWQLEIESKNEIAIRYTARWPKSS